GREQEIEPECRQRQAPNAQNQPDQDRARGTLELQAFERFGELEAAFARRLCWCTHARLPAPRAGMSSSGGTVSPCGASGSSPPPSLCQRRSWYTQARTSATAP